MIDLWDVWFSGAAHYGIRGDDESTRKFVQREFLLAMIFMNGRKSWRAACFLLAFLLLASFTAPSCSSYRAQKDFDRALKLGEEGKTEEMVEWLKRVEQDFPGTSAARRAAAIRPLYEGLIVARERFPVRRAMDILRQTSRVVERYRERTRRLPTSLQEMVPGELPSLPRDPWGSELLYERRGDHYALSTLGEDRMPGGEGEKMDLRVVDGHITLGPSWAER